MTLHRELNLAGFGGNYFTWNLTEAMIAAGWTVTRSGSGTGGVFTAGDVFDRGGANPVRGADATTTGPAGSAHWGRQWAWMVLQDPGGNREWLFQREGANLDNTGDDDWLVMYSPAAGFTGGDPTTRATATDEHEVCNDTTIFQDGNTSTLSHAVADDTPISGEYGFWGLQIRPGSLFAGYCAQDPLQNNEGAPTNPHPLLLYCTDLSLTRASHSVRPSTTDNTRGHLWLDVGLGGEQWGRAILLYVIARTSGPVVYPGGAGVSPWDGKERPMVIPVHGMPLANAGYLGTSTWLRWKAVATRDYPDKAASPDPYLYMNDMMLYGWDPAVTPGSVP